MEYMELVKELEQKLVLNQERNDCNSFVADNGEVYSFWNNINSNTANLGGGLFFHFLKINGDIFLRNQHVLLFPYSVFLVNVGCWLCPRFLDQFLIICFHSFGRSNDLLFLAMCNEMGRMISCVFLNGLYTYLYI